MPRITMLAICTSCFSRLKDAGEPYRSKVPHRATCTTCGGVTHDGLYVRKHHSVAAEVSNG